MQMVLVFAAGVLFGSAAVFVISALIVGAEAERKEEEIRERNK